MARRSVDIGWSGRPCHERIAELRMWLEAGGLAGGPAGLLPLLADAWDCLHDADATGMRPHKLDRIEQPGWRPPLLTFRIARHAALARGAATADMQAWTVDLDRWSARPRSDGVRAVAARATPPLPAALAEQAAALVAERRWDHPWLTFDDAAGELVVDEAAVLGGVPRDVGAAGRRARFREHLARRLAALGWQPAGPAGRFRRTG